MVSTTQMGHRAYGEPIWRYGKREEQHLIFQDASYGGDIIPGESGSEDHVHIFWKASMLEDKLFN